MDATPVPASKVSPAAKKRRRIGTRLYVWFRVQSARAPDRLRRLYQRFDDSARSLWHALVFEYPLVGVPLLILICGLSSWVLYQLAVSYVAPTTSTERADLIRTAAQLAGGALVLAGIYWTARNVYVNREGQITDRFTRAIDQLGSTDDSGNPRIEIRLGGMYALERIARDSLRDQGPILEVLTAYLREHAKRPPEARTPWQPTEEDLDRLRAEFENTPAPPGFPTPRADIQAAVTVIGRRQRRRPYETDHPLDLAIVDLRHANLSRLNLAGAQLEYADLRRTNLDYANLRQCNFMHAILEGVNFSSAQIHDATFAFAKMNGALFMGVSYRDGQFADCELRNADFQEARQSRTSFIDNDLSRARFVRARLDGAYFAGADSILDGTDFTDAYLAGTVFRNVDLRQVKGLSALQLSGARIEGSTQLPDILQGRAIDAELVTS